MESLVQSLSTKVLELVMMALAPILAGYVVLIVHRFAAKIGVQLTAEQDAQAKAAITDIIKAVEEQGRRENLTGDQKAALAKAAVVASGHASGTEADQKIDTAVHEVKREGLSPILAAGR